MPHLSLVRADDVSAHPLPGAAASGVPHGVIVEPSAPGWCRITVHHRTRGLLHHGAVRAALVTDPFLRALARYFLDDPAAIERAAG